MRRISLHDKIAPYLGLGSNHELKLLVCLLLLVQIHKHPLIDTPNYSPNQSLWGFDLESQLLDAMPHQALALMVVI